MDNKYGEEFVPKRATKFSAGYDLYAVEDMLIEPWTRVFDTGVYFDGSEELYMILGFADCSYPKTYETKNLEQWVALILPRSSYGFKYGLKFANTVCVIDKDYRDTIKVSLSANHKFTIRKGERFGQMIFIPYGVLINEIKPESERNGGIGSTGE